MNLQNSQTVKNYIKVFIFFLASFLHVTVRAWEVDFSRREKELTFSRLPAAVETVPGVESGWLDKISTAFQPEQEVVIIQTENGFIPDTVRLKSGQNYRFHVVNVNESNKNVSFIMEAFSRHEATYFGKTKSFTVTPKVEGIFSFECPETAKQGKVVVVPGEKRQLASE